MSFFKLDEDDLFINTIEAYPEYKFYIQGGTIYINDLPHISGSKRHNLDNILGVPKGFISLYEYNIDRPTGEDFPALNKIYPFVIKSGMKDTFKNVRDLDNSPTPTHSPSKAEILFNSQYQWGDKVQSSYNMSASIYRYYYDANNTGSARPRVNALKNVFNHYSVLSPHYQYSSSLGFGDKSEQLINLISIPSIMYGSSIKKGSVNLKYYITGTLIGELSDYRRNGDLIQVGPEGSGGSGSVAGVVLYNEGFVALTGSWAINTGAYLHSPPASGFATFLSSSWIHFGYGANDGNTISSDSLALSSSFSLEYSGTNHVPTMTMLAHAKYGELNHSTNPTFLSSSETFSVSTGSFQYIEQPKKIKNVVYSAFTDKAPKFEKTVYISKIGIYDEDKNLVGVVKLATPIKKTEAQQYTFKLKLDM